MEAVPWLEVALAIALLGGVGAVFWERVHRDKGMGQRTIQILSILMIVPLVGLLSLRDVLTGEAVATILGTIVGYVLAGVGNSASGTDGT
jgi:hypothetical protein